MTDYAKIGTVVLLARHAPRPGASPLVHRPHLHGARPGHPSVGWTTPTIIYDKMREIDAGARELNALMVANVRKPVLLAAWGAWFARWTVFFAKYQGVWAKIGVLLYTDDLARQTEDYRMGYASFRATYERERDDKGAPLPAPAAPIPEVLPDPSAPPPPDAPKKPWFNFGIEIPWWVWLVGGAGMTVGGYFLVKRILWTRRELAAKGKVAQELLPAYLSGALPVAGPAVARIHQAHAASDPDSRAMVPSDIFTAQDPGTPDI
jgi:hypothetical protein